MKERERLQKRKRERERLTNENGIRMEKNELILINYSTKMEYIYNPKNT